MANRHFAKLADVWKHLALCEILSSERPASYWESHAGSAAYVMVDDPERNFGALRFWQHAHGSPVLERSRYLSHLRRFNPDGRLETYPGSSLLAMSELGAKADYVLCETDPASVEHLRAWTTQLRLGGRVTIVQKDGPIALHDALEGNDPAPVLTHIDPFDPWSRGTGGLSALDVAAELADAGVRTVHWYGYDRPALRAWALEDIGRQTGAPLWNGDFLVTSSEPPAETPVGDLGVATTAGTGFGIVCAHLTDRTLERCAALGHALAAMWRGVPLPGGEAGGLDFAVRSRR